MANKPTRASKYNAYTRKRLIVLKDDGWKLLSDIDIAMDPQYHDFQARTEEVYQGQTKIIRSYFELKYESDSLPQKPGLFLITVNNEISYIGRSSNLKECLGQKFQRVPGVEKGDDINHKFFSFQTHIVYALKNDEKVRLYYMEASSLNCEQDPIKLIEFQQNYYESYNRPIWNPVEPIEDTEGDWSSFND